MDKIRVLVVDDNAATRALARGFLDKLEGVEICGEAGDGLAALELIYAEGPDLILLDIVMPRMDGAGVLRALREKPPAKRPKIAVVTHLCDDDFLEYAVSLGANYYMLKPVNYRELCRSLLDMYGGNGRSGEPDSPAAARAQFLLEQMGGGTLRGCHYAALTAEALAADPALLLKMAYGPAAKAGRTSAANIDKNIRDVIRKIHSIGSGRYAALMGGLPASKPNNERFLRALADAIRADPIRPSPNHKEDG